MADRGTQDLTGQRLGHFRVDGVIGRGGMSVLYRATDTRLGRRVALKVIDEALAADREFRERFVEEARNTSAVDHAHVVPLYDFDETDGHLYIAMRHVEGPDLASIIDGRPLTVPRTLRLLAQVADALDAVHARGLVHLDVKPANVLVTTRESAGEHVYLADFGLTRRGATGHRTSGGDFLGSPTYAAPEHLRGEPVDARTDVYSLTCVLFTCLTGRAPYLGSVTEVIDGHLGGEVPSVSDLVGLDPRLDDVVHRGMDPDRPRRHESASAVVEAARGALTGPGPASLVGPDPGARRPDGPARQPGPRSPTAPHRRPGPPPVPTVAAVPVPPVRAAEPVPPVPAAAPAPPAAAVAPVAPIPAATPAAPVSPVPPGAAGAGGAASEGTAEEGGTPTSGASSPAPPAPPPPRAAPPGRRPSGPAPSGPLAAMPSGPFPAPGPSSGAFRAAVPRSGPSASGPPSGAFAVPGAMPSGPFPPAGPPSMPSRTSAAPPVRLRDPVPPDRDGFSRSPGAVPGRVGPIVGGVVVLVVVLVVVVLLVLLLT